MKSPKELYRDLYDVLKKLGLTEYEIQLYTISLASGPVSIAKLGELMRMSRPNVYKVIAGLERHGLAQFSTRKKYARTFVVESPTVVQAKLHEQEETFARLEHSVISLMPDLMAAYQQGGSPLKVKVLTTKEECFSILMQMTMEEKECLELVGSTANLIELITPTLFEKLVAVRIERGVKARMLTTKSPEAEALRVRGFTTNREVLYLPENKKFPANFQVASNKILFWQAQTGVAILIEDNSLSQMLRSMIDFLCETVRGTTEAADQKPA